MAPEFLNSCQDVTNESKYFGIL